MQYCKKVAKVQSIMAQITKKLLLLLGSNISITTNYFIIILETRVVYIEGGKFNFFF